jgi:hypothetical protein
MIKRDHLMKFARDLAAQRANLRPSLVAAYIAGSVARGDPPLGEAADLDLFLIDEAPGAALPAPEDVQIAPQIVAEITYRRAEFYKDTGALRAHCWLGPEIAEGLALHDGRHFFERIQAGVRGRFDQPMHVHARAQGFVAWAQGELAALAPAMQAPHPGPPDARQLSSFALALQFAAEALITLDHAVGPARRLMLRLDDAAQVFGRPDLYQDFLNTMNALGLTPDEGEALVSIWASMYDAAGEFHRGEWGEEFFVQPLRRNYYEQALRAMLAEGRARDIAWLLLYTGSACASQVRQHAPAGADYLYLDKWNRALERLGLDSGAGFARGVGLLRAYVGKVTEFVEWWAEMEGA